MTRKYFTIFVPIASLTLAILFLESACYLLLHFDIHFPVHNTHRQETPPKPFPFEMTTSIHKANRYPPVPIPSDNSRVDYSEAKIAEIVDGYFDNKPSQAVRAKGKENRDGDTLFDITFTTDTRGRRISPGELHFRSLRKKHLLALGCSYTLGLWVNDYESIPAVINNSTTVYAAYNLGHGGDHAGNIYARIIEKNLLGEIHQREGVALYLYIPQHLSRTLGQMSWISVASDITFKLSQKNGHLVNEGVYQEAAPINSFILKILAKSNFLKFFEIDLPILNEKDLTLFVEIVKEIQNEYHLKFGKNNRFIFVFLPAPPPIHIEKLKDLLNKNEIYFIDYASWGGFMELVDGAPQIMYDAHPNEKSYRAMADLIIEDLRLK